MEPLPAWRMVTAEDSGEMADDGGHLDDNDHLHQLPLPQGDDNPSFREMRSPRLRHTHHVLSQLRAYLSSTPDELNATLRCRDGDFLTNKTLLAAMSAFLRSHLTPFADALIVVPGLTKCQVNTFFRYLFSDRFVQDFDCADVAALDAVCAELRVDGLEISSPICLDDSRDLLAEAILDSLGDDDPQQQDPDYHPHDDLLPQQDTQDNVAERTVTTMSKKKEPSKRPRGRPPSTNKDKTKDKKRKACLFCDKTYTYTRNRNLHMIERHMGECRARGMIKPCGSCDEVFVSSKGRKMHHEKAHGIKRGSKKDAFPEQRHLVCRTCGKKRSSLQSLRAHISGEHPDQILDCLMCGEATADKAAFFRHIQTHVYAADNVFYRCHVCPTNFAVKYELQQHAKRTHPPSTSFVCGECDLTFYDARNLGRHVMRQHGLDNEYTVLFCPHCERSFRHEAHLQRHLRKHTGVAHGSAHCSACGKSFPHESLLKEHLMMDHPNLTGCYRCWDCGDTFQGRCELASHLDSEGHLQQRALRKVDDIYKEVDDRKREEESRHFEQMQNLDHMSEEIVLEATGGNTDTTSIDSLLQD